MSNTPSKSTLKKPTPLSKAYSMCPLREVAYKESEMREVSEQLEKAGYQPRSAGALRWRITHKLRKDPAVDN
ncbi:uncharacterized protein LOC62_02G002743 [Vanrija pseudolonga]|uniref:Uncharacterized protein n=1 Tax=Vanrija pseudolonga TaxID=143232 RepID=A0AAF0Y6V7_9TREE|nr:hypothetical protein LOC62_02G002743 [Vanrija pseudolonga]